MRPFPSSSVSRTSSPRVPLVVPRTLAFGSALAALLLLLVLPGAATAVDRGDRAPELGARDLSGQPVRVSAMRGKVLLVDFWATWCEPCRQELPFLQRLHERYGDEGLVVVGVSVDEDLGKVRRFVRRNGIGFTVVHDREKRIADRYGLERMPTNYLVDRRGVIRHVNPTFRAEHAERIENQVKRLLADR